MYSIVVNLFTGEQMSKRSPALVDKRTEIIALLQYTKKQSKKTDRKLELEFVGKDHGGTTWWRWMNRNIQPEIRLVSKIYKFVSNQLITGEWDENGEEIQWAPLLPAVIDSKLSFLSNESKRSTLLEILKQIENPLVTERMLRGVAAGYYLPGTDDIQKIFWSKPPEKIGDENEYVPWHRIWSDTAAEKEQMELLMTEIFMRIWVTSKNHDTLRRFAGEWGFVYEFSEENLYSLSDQMHHQIQQDALSLHEIRQRINYIYPSEFKWTDDWDDESVKITRQRNIKLHECVAIADNKLRAYSEHINSISKSSIMFGLFKKLALLNLGNPSSKWIYPKIEIM